jgi:hypothetical protein
MASDSLARLLAHQPRPDDLLQEILARLTQPAYLSVWDPVTGANTVLITGTQEFTNLAVLGDPAALSVGRVLLLRTAGAPVILGRLRVPPF